MAVDVDPTERLLDELRAPFLALDSEQERLDRFRWDTPAFAAFCCTIVNKQRKRVALIPKLEQLRYDRALEEQRQAGLPMRAVILKARQIGFSTWTQAKMIQRVTQQPDHTALVLGQVNKTASELFKIGETIWKNLPEQVPGFKPKRRYTRRGRYIELDNDSWYEADNAKEYEAGRGLTLVSLHCSEVASYDDAERKLTGLLEAVPDEPETLIVLESTAKGQNYFKDLWESAVTGESGYIPFFSGWWHEASYQLAFANEPEQEEFRESIGEGTIGEDEPALVDLLLGEGFTELDVLEKLQWRRRKIRTNFKGDVDTFHQEYPSTPEDAFLTTGRHVFDIPNVRRMQQRVRREPEPATGRLESKGPLKSRLSRGVTVHYPTAVEFVACPINDDRSPGWRVWEMPRQRCETDDGVIEKGQYIIGGDASGGDEIEGTGAYHVLSVCDHRTRRQVAEYRSRIDPDELALEALKACLFFNNAWIGIEVTGSWGGPAMRRLWKDFKYPFVYFRKRLDSAGEKQEDRLGWHTGFAEKKMIVAELKEMLRCGDDGTMSRGLADEYGWYILDDRNRMKPEQKKTADRLLARGIAVCIAREKPLRPDRKPGDVSSSIDATFTRSGYIR